MTDLAVPERTALAQAELEISGMTCASCATRVEKALAKVPGVSHVSVNLATEKATVDLHDAASTGALVEAVRKAGYEATPVAPEADPSAADTASSAASDFGWWRERGRQASRARPARSCRRPPPCGNATPRARSGARPRRPPRARWRPLPSADPDRLRPVARRAPHRRASRRRVRRPIA